MYIHFFANLSRYFVTTQLARYFPQFRFPDPILLDEASFYHNSLNFPFAYRKDQRIHIHIPEELKKSISSVSIKQKNKELYNHLWSEQNQVDFILDRHLYPELHISGKADDKILSFRERLVPMPGTCNFRDIGGYITNEKKSVKWGKVFRADNLGNLNFNSWAILKELGIKTVIDFRGREERLKSIDRLPSNIRYVPIPIQQGEQEDMIKGALLRGEGNKLDAYQIMKDIYVFLVESAVEQYQMFFDILKDEKNYPLVFHCTAGKDRTGYAAALILHLLGVNKQTILHDYMLSNLYRHKENHILIEKGKFFLKKDILADFLKVQSDYLEQALSHIKSNYTSIDNYLKDRLKVTEKDKKSIADFLLE
ncbi:MAG: hypothetical protein CMO01_04775 [Thalassobius sp.]|nr:hypothetical protein [Thalassovita sp.]